MNFLKITGLVVGTGSVVGGTGAGVYYGVIKNTQEEKPKITEDEEIQFTGKLVFEKKIVNDNTIYEVKLLNTDQYASEESTFNANKTKETEKYAKVNKIVDISCLLNIEVANAKLKEIFKNQTEWKTIKAKITTEETNLKSLFGNEIYTKLVDKFKDVT